MWRLDGKQQHHVPKTAGSKVGRVMRDFGATVGAPSHCRATTSPAHLERFATIRPPCAWYWSLYRHVVHAPRLQVRQWLAAYGNGSTAWPDVLRGWLDPATVQTPPPTAGLLYASEQDVYALQLAEGCGLWTAMVYDLLTEVVDGERVWAVDVLLDAVNVVPALRVYLGRDVPDELVNHAGKRDHPLSSVPWTEALDLPARWRVADADGDLAGALGLTEHGPPWLVWRGLRGQPVLGSKW